MFMSGYPNRPGNHLLLAVKTSDGKLSMSQLRRSRIPAGSGC